MKAKILEQQDYKKWDDFIKDHPYSSIHQSTAWGNFQSKVKNRGKFWIIALEKDNKIVAGTMLVRHKLPKGYSWLYAPRGPLLEQNEGMTEIMDSIGKIGKKEKSIFLRIDPPLSRIKKHKVAGFHTVHGFQPEDTLIIDLKKSEEDILAEMKPKGRYNIRLARKKGVEVYKADPKSEKFDKEISRFYEILQETTQRDGFRGHDKQYYKDMIESLGEKAALYLAKYEGKIIAGTIVTFFKDTAIYYYGASSNDYRNVMAPYLLQWTAIKEAKEKNGDSYDFLGIAPSGAKNHPWKGVTDFKKKFGGKEVSYLKAQEKPLKKLHYLAYRIYKFLRS